MTEREADRTTKGEPPARNFYQFVGTKKPHNFVRLKMVPRAGVEPAHPKIQDFESSASANSAIWAYSRLGKKATYPLNARIRF